MYERGCYNMTQNWFFIDNDSWNNVNLLTQGRCSRCVKLSILKLSSAETLHISYYLSDDESALKPLPEPILTNFYDVMWRV